MNTQWIVAWMAVLLAYMFVVLCFFLIVKYKHRKNSNQIPIPGFITSSFWKIEYILFSLFILLFTALVMPSPDVLNPHLPIFDEIAITGTEPLTIHFNRPIPSFTKASIAPSVPGTWVRTGRIPFFPDKLIFYPQRSIDADTEFIAEIQNISSIAPLFGIKPHDLLFSFKTPPFPEIKEIIPTTELKSSDQIMLLFNSPSVENIEWIVESNPINNFLIKISQDRLQATLFPQLPLIQGTVYQLNLFRRRVVYDYQSEKIIEKAGKELVKQIEIKTVESPVIEQIVPEARKVYLDEPINITFKHAMDQQSFTDRVKITPEKYFEFAWQNQNQFIITAKENWEVDTKYEILLKQGIVTEEGGKLEADISLPFTTIGPAQVVATNPENHSINVKLESRLEFQFDQEIEKESLENHFTISPQVDGVFEVSANQAVFIPGNNLIPDQEYTVTITEGLESTRGLNSSQPFSFQFKTVPNTFSLDVPLFKQHHAFSCFSIAAKMVLTYRGVENVGEISLLDEIGYDKTPRNFVKNSWGDPNQAIVGSLDGEGSGGYGTHWSPVASALNKYRPVEVKRNWNINELLQKVYEGNPVIVWWVNGVWPTRDISWNIPNGEKIYTVSGMHTEVVTGWVGSQSNPDYILTNDPWRGKRKYTPQQFLNLWKWFDNTAIVVY